MLKQIKPDTPIAYLTVEQLCDLLREVAQEQQVLAKYESHTASDGNDTMLTAKQVRTILQVDKSTLYRWNNSQYLRVHKVGGRNMYYESDVKQILARKAV